MRGRRGQFARDVLGVEGIPFAHGVHVAHVVIDGAIDTEFIRSNFPERAALKDRDGILSPEAIAEAYWQLHSQHRTAWTHEMDLRPWMETW